MKNLNSLILSFVFLLILSGCEPSRDSSSPTSSSEAVIFKLESPKYNSQFTYGQAISFAIHVEQPVDSIHILYQDKLIHTDTKTNFSLQSSAFGAGKKSIKVKLYSQNGTATKNSQFIINSDIVPETIEYKVVNSYSHAITSYTQGFEFDGGVLYESTGQYGESTLQKTDYKQAKNLGLQKLEDRYFGEGLTIYNDKVYQLTWREKKCLVYDKNNLDFLFELNYPYQFEGWGIAAYKDQLMVSDGTSKIRILSPEDFSLISEFTVVDDKGDVNALNELEVVNDVVFANIYRTNLIAKIDIASGRVLGYLNLKELEEQITKHDEIDVLNGIAYHKEKNSYFVTGKNWPKIFEITLLNQ